MHSLQALYYLFIISQHAVVVGKTPVGLKTSDIENIMQLPICPKGSINFAVSDGQIN